MSRKKVNIEATNETKNQLEGIDLIIAVKKTHFEKGAFFVTAKTIADLLTEKVLTTDKYGNEKKELANDLTGVDLKVLLVLSKFLEADNHLKKVTHKQLAEMLLTTRPAITRSISNLVKAGLLKREEDGLSFSEEYFYTGKRKPTK
jgi:DNA-binding MarR family transcriptional regulator